MVLVRFDLCRPRRIRYHQAKRARGPTKIEFIMNQGTPVQWVLWTKLFLGGKSYPIAKPLLVVWGAARDPWGGGGGGGGVEIT